MWGDVVKVEKESSKLESFASAKVIIDTLSVYPIEDEAIIQVDDLGFKVSVFEAKTEYTIFHTRPIDEDSSGPSVLKENGKLAAMGSDGNMEDQVIPVQDNWQKDHSNGVVRGSREDEQARTESSNLNLNSIPTLQEAQPRD